jgi:hypothetical protein
MQARVALRRRSLRLEGEVLGDVFRLKGLVCCCFCLMAMATIVGRGPIGSSLAAGDQRQRHRLVADPVK